MSSFYTENELKELGLKHYGKDVLISRKTSIYGAENISIGNNVRIDDFCILSGNITIGNHCHFAAYSSIFAGDSNVSIGNFSGLSSYSCIYAVTDDYIMPCLNGPEFPDKYRKVRKAPVKFNDFSGVASGTKIFPGVELAEGSVIGPMSMVLKSTKPWKFYMGTPARSVVDRSEEETKKIANEFLKEYNMRKK